MCNFLCCFVKLCDNYCFWSWFLDFLVLLFQWAGKIKSCGVKQIVLDHWELYLGHWLWKDYMWGVMQSRDALLRNRWTVVFTLLFVWCTGFLHCENSLLIVFWFCGLHALFFHFFFPFYIDFMIYDLFLLFMHAFGILEALKSDLEMT